ncbi:MAG: hypothetical protein SFW67_18120 [Myxococcaceae bacterium]|nr:hypothetical protein [Myxococcaceae bacterium]
MRTTIDIDGPILRDLKRLQKVERKTLKALVSELLEDALRHRRVKPAPRTLRWTAKPMGARIDIDDRVALQALLDREDSGR